MRNSILLFMFLSQFCFSQNDNNFKSEQKLVVSTKGHIKSEGIDLFLKYPANWILSSGERPHVLYNVKNPSHDIYSIIAIFDTMEFASEEEKSNINKLLDKDDFVNIIVKGFPDSSNCDKFFIESGYESVTSEKCLITKVENITTSLTSGYVTNERAGHIMESFNVQYQIPFESKIISISFSFVNYKEEKDQILALLFSKMVINTLVINNLWTKK